MTIIRRLPVYAAGAGFTGALVAVAAARDWSGLQTLAAALSVAVFYVVTILVPWLIREQVGPAGTQRRIRDIPHGAWHVDAAQEFSYSVELRPGGDHGWLIPESNGGDELVGIPTTHGPRTVRHTEPQVIAR